MLVALPPSSQFLSRVFPALICVGVGLLQPATGSNALPSALTRFRAFSAQRSVPVMSFCPFLLDQKPSVNAPLAPVQTLPKLQLGGLAIEQSEPTVKS